MAKKTQSFKTLGIIGIVGVVFYFLHLIIGQINYNGYSAATQAVSDLTTKGAPARTWPLIFLLLYGLCQSIFSFGMFTLLRDKFTKYFYVGSLTFFLLHIISFIGFALFPSNLIGWRNVMHMLTTVLVLALTIISLIMFSINFLKIKSLIMASTSIIATMLIIFGGVLTRMAPTTYFGYAERIGVFTMVIYSCIMAGWLITYRPRALSWY